MCLLSLCIFVPSKLSINNELCPSIFVPSKLSINNELCPSLGKRYMLVTWCVSTRLCMNNITAELCLKFLI